MNMFSLESNDLAILNPEGAVKFFRNILFAEASRMKISLHLIEVTDNINVGDGGLDANVNNPLSETNNFIPEKLSGFQIKASDLSPKACQEEFHQEKDLEKPLKPAIEQLLKNDGTYVLVLFYPMPKETMKKNRKDAIIEDLEKNGFKNPKVRLYTIENMIGLANNFPALVSKLKRIFWTV